MATAAQRGDEPVDSDEMRIAVLVLELHVGRRTIRRQMQYVVAVGCQRRGDLGGRGNLQNPHLRPHFFVAGARTVTAEVEVRYGVEQRTQLGLDVQRCALRACLFGSGDRGSGLTWPLPRTRALLGDPTMLRLQTFRSTCGSMFGRLNRL